MSALQANTARVMPVRPSAPRPETTKPTQPSLRLVEAPAQERSSFKFMMFCVAVVALGILAVLLLNTEMANGAYERNRLQQQLSQEVITGEQLNAKLADVSTAENLAKKAKKLGMMQEVNPDVLHIDSKKVAAKRAAQKDAN